jgi:hypothetical protein
MASSGDGKRRREDMPEYRKSRRPRYPFGWLAVPLALILVFTFGPTASLLLGSIVSGLLDCHNPVSAAEPCLFMGIDFSQTVTAAILIGFLGLATLPTGMTLLGIWLFAAIIVTLVWWLRRRQTTANE